MKAVRILAGVLSILAALSCARLESAAEGVEENVLRLHVVAASDSERDQRLKLAARDAVLEALAPLLADCQSREEAAAVVEAHLDELACAAASAAGQSARACLSRESFPTREYAGFALPAGEYAALRVTLDGGGGHNWWCVVFPPLCTNASADTADAFALFDKEETALIAGSGRVVKLKLVEWARAILHRAGKG